jgi:hypothetical protein
MPKLDPSLLLQAFGITFLGIGMAVRLGVWKKWYWKSRGTVYGYIPLGLVFLLYSFESLARQRLGTSYWLYQVAFGVIIAVGVWWTLRTPPFIKPAWVRWVEGHSPSVLKAMEADAQSDPNWEKHVVSEQAVEAWIRSLDIKKPKTKGSAKAKK